MDDSDRAREASLHERHLRQRPALQASTVRAFAMAPASLAPMSRAASLMGELTQTERRAAEEIDHARPVVLFSIFREFNVPPEAIAAWRSAFDFDIAARHCRIHRRFAFLLDPRRILPDLTSRVRRLILTTWPSGVSRLWVAYGRPGEEAEQI